MFFSWIPDNRGGEKRKVYRDRLRAEPHIVLHRGEDGVLALHVDDGHGTSGGWSSDAFSACVSTSR